MVKTLTGWEKWVNKKNKLKINPWFDFNKNVKTRVNIPTAGFYSIVFYSIKNSFTVRCFWKESPEKKSKWSFRSAVGQSFRPEVLVELRKISGWLMTVIPTYSFEFFISFYFYFSLFFPV